MLKRARVRLTPSASMVYFSSRGWRESVGYLDPLEDAASFVIETVSHSGDSQDKLWMFWLWLDFLTELRYIDVQAMDSGVRLLSPDLFEQYLARENLATVDNEHLEQIEFGRGQGDLLSGELNSPPRKIDGERTDLEAWFGAVWWLDDAAQGNAHPCQHFVDAKGLGDVVISSQVERLHLVAFGILD